MVGGLRGRADVDEVRAVMDELNFFFLFVFCSARRMQ